MGTPAWMNLQNTIQELSAKLASEILLAFKGATFAEIAEVGGKPGKRTKASGKRIRRSLEDIQAMAKKVAKSIPSAGMRAEQIRESLDIDRKDLPRILREALTLKLVKSKGQKRATTYFAV